jgi:hypothetical protein
MGTRQLLCQRQSSIWSDQRNTDEARKRRGEGLHGKSSVLSRKMWEQKVGVMGMDISTDHQKDDFIQNQPSPSTVNLLYRSWLTRLMKSATNQPGWLIISRQPGSIISPTSQL